MRTLELPSRFKPMVSRPVTTGSTRMASQPSTTRTYRGDCKLKIQLVFDDWRRARGKKESIYYTDEGVELSMGEFHSGTTFNATIDVEYEEDWLREQLEAGYEPVFYVILPEK